MPKPKSTKSVKTSKLNLSSDLEERKVLNKKKKPLRSISSNKKNYKLSNVIKLSEKSILPISKNKKVYSIVLLIYLILTLLFVRGLSTTANVQTLRAGYGGNSFSSDLSVFNNLLGTGVSGSTATGNLFQTILFIIFSLVFIWMIRKTMKNKAIKVRDSFYKSQSQIIPFIIIILILFLELIPLLLGIFLYATVFNNGIAAHVAEKILWGGISLIFVLISVYFLLSTIFSIYIVSLEDVRPIEAYRAAWRLVKGRRLLVLRKLLFLPIALMIVIGLVSIIFIAIIPQIADFIYFALTLIAVLLAHSYLYNLYRELI